MSEEFRSIRRSLDALVLVIKNLADIQQITNDKVDYLIEVIDKPDSEDNPIADAIKRMAVAMEALTDELRARMPPRATH